MIFRTEVAIKQQKLIDFDSKLMLIGSCFSENIGQKLTVFQFDADCNPIGILYNPMSIATAVERILELRLWTDDELFFHENRWRSWAHHGSFAKPDKCETLEGINSRLVAANQQLTAADLLLITFGSSWVYEFDGQIVGNCHRVPNNQFVRRRLEIDEIVTRYAELFTRLFERNSSLRIVLTVSPIRYIRNNIIENSTNKAILLLAAEKLCQMFPQIDYFPAYEIVLDELRDYRFFADDMAHPSPLAVEYVWERFAQTYLTDNALQQLPTIEKSLKRLQHRERN